MAEIWPVPQFDRGDENEDETFHAVGLVMSSWESVEFELARLSSCFAGDPDGPSVMAYGTGRIFRDRVSALTDLACKRFVRLCNQDIEGEFSSIISTAIAASDRRNDIAHGIVMQVDTISHFRNQIPATLLRRPHYALIPPYYLMRKHIGGLPTYAYRSRDMHIICHRLKGLVHRIAQHRSLHHF